jgi:hypothetical protein
MSLPPPLSCISIPLKNQRSKGTNMYLPPVHVHALIINWKTLGMYLPPIIHPNAFDKKWKEENMCLPPFYIRVPSKKLGRVGMCLPFAFTSLSFKLCLEEIG